MNKLLTASLLAMGVALSAPAHAATNLTLPAAVNADLTAATSAQDVADIINSLSADQANLIPTILATAAGNGVSASAVLTNLISPSTPQSRIVALVEAASEAVPDQADRVASAAYTAKVGSGSADTDLASAITTAAVDGVEVAGRTTSQVASEAAEVVSALQDLLPGTAGDSDIANAAADATNDTSDSGSTIQTAANDTGDGTETADSGDTGGVLDTGDTSGGQQGGGNTPSAAQNNPGDGNSPT